MHKQIRVLAIAALVGLSICGRSMGAGVADEFLSGMTKIAGAVEQIKDEASARKAAEVIASVNADMQKTAVTLSEMSDAEKSSIFASRATEFQTVQMRLATAMQSLVAQPQWLSIISDEMKNMPMVNK